MDRSECLAMIVWGIVLFLFTNTTFADISGPVVSVLDGDTIEVLHNTYPERVRLAISRCDIDGWGKGV
jgi:endonuclease YncB( thermonuclease family)